MFRFSLFTLFAAMVVISLGCAALAYASLIWAQLVVAATILALLSAAVGAFYLPEKARAFAGGFAIFGWGYLLLTQGPWLESRTKAELLLTRKITQAAPDRANLPQTVTVDVEPADGGGMVGGIGGGNIPSGGPALGGGALGGGGGGSQMIASNPALLYFQSIAEWLWIIVLAFIGGVLASVFDGRRRKAKLA